MIDLERLAALLARAFDDDPTMGWVFAGSARPGDDLRRLFAANLRHAARHGRVDRHPDGGAPSGVALWLGPGAFPMSFRQVLLSGHAVLPFTLGVASLRRLRRLNAYAHMQHARAAGGPHWYLHGIGVAPEWQRQGVGSALLRLGLDRADRDRLPCYLETARESALPFYTRFGFRVAIPGRLPPDGPPVFSLVRPAAVKRPPMAAAARRDGRGVT